MTFEFNISNHTLSLVSPASLYSGNSNYYDCRFNFLSDDWANTVKFAVFTCESNSYSVLIEDDRCVIPSEVLIDSSSVFVGVYGTNSSTDNYVRISTGLVYLFVTDGAYKEAVTPSVPTPDIWEKYYAEITRVGGYADRAESAAYKALSHAYNAQECQYAANQALSDLLAMIGTDIATLVDGKIPVSQIPSIATTEVRCVSSADEMENLVVENGDICIRTDENKSYIYNNGWVYLISPTDYAAVSGYAETAKTAENANTINNHRLVEMTAEEYDTAAKDENTYYLVY